MLYKHECQFMSEECTQCCYCGKTLQEMAKEAIPRIGTLDENEITIRNVYIQTIQNLAKERDELREHKRLLFEENGRLLVEKEAGLWDSNHPVRKAARQVVSHWNEFGPEYGLDESIYYLEKALSMEKLEDK